MAAVHDGKNFKNAEELVRGVMPEKISECSLASGKTKTCIRESALKDLSAIFNVSFKNPEQVVEDTKKATGCKTQKCVLTKAVESSKATPEIKASLAEDVKHKGPTDSQFLSNVNVDGILKQWSKFIPGMYPYNFNMLNYAKYSWRNNRVFESPDTLATVCLRELVCERGYTTAGCIINSDIYQNAGKHWMALFVDTRGKDRWTVEFFNSSGNSPAPEWVNWLVKSRGQLETVVSRRPPRVEIVTATGLRQQYSKSECGLYSLFYIWARLCGVSAEHFKKIQIPDRYMFELRHHLFVDSPDKVPQPFDWGAYQKMTPIGWESQHHDR